MWEDVLVDSSNRKSHFVCTSQNQNLLILRKALMQIPFDKEKGNRRQQLQRVYSEIIHGNLAEFRQEQSHGKCEK